MGGGSFSPVDGVEGLGSAHLSSLGRAVNGLSVERIS